MINVVYDVAARWGLFTQILGRVTSEIEIHLSVTILYPIWRKTKRHILTNLYWANVLALTRDWRLIQGFGERHSHCQWGAVRQARVWQDE